MTETEAGDAAPPEDGAVGGAVGGPAGAPAEDTAPLAADSPAPESSESAPAPDPLPTDDGDLIPLGRLTGLALVLWAAVGLAASFELSWDKVRLLEDPNFQPSCNFNPVLSCGSVIATDQANAFGFPNPFMGLIGFAVIATLGMLAISRTRIPGWILAGAALGSWVGVGFVHWLAYQSLYEIDALCPWCLGVWAVTMPTAVWLTLIAMSRSSSDAVASVAVRLWTWRYSIVFAWYLLIATLILINFWDYWRTLL